MNKTKMQVLNMFAAAAVVVAIPSYAADVVQKSYDKNYNKNRFTAADTNGDGLLSKEEAAASTKSFEGRNGIQRFDNADTNGDGMLSLEEAAGRKKFESEKGSAKAREAQDKHYNSTRFQQADTNGDGLLSRQEAAASTKSFEGRGGSKRFDAADTNGDDMLSLEEASQQKMRERRAY